MYTKSLSKLCLCLALLMFMVIDLSAQTDKEAVILYKRTPVQVLLSMDGQINKFIQEKPDYLADFTGYKKVGIVFDKPIVFDEEQFETFDGAVPKGKVVNINRTFIEFNEGFAILDQEALSDLNDIVSYLKESREHRIHITGHLKSDSKSDKLLTQNRVRSCVQYLGIKGIPTDQFSTETIKNVSMNNTLSVNYVE